MSILIGTWRKFLEKHVSKVEMFLFGMQSRDGKIVITSHFMLFEFVNVHVLPF